VERAHPVGGGGGARLMISTSEFLKIKLKTYEVFDEIKKKEPRRLESVI
jgi:hypothetical protein